MKILFIGDIVGHPGRKAVEQIVPKLIRSEGLDLVIANGENSAGGSGLTPAICEELFSAGVDVITSGDHIWKKRDVYEYLDKTHELLRPLNYPKGAPGRGSVVVKSKSGEKAGVMNLLGRVFMEAVENPFTLSRNEAERLKKETPVIIVDMHAEATSEKIAISYHLDGLASAVLGTHTHVQTSDEKILPGGTAYITDAGMTGPFDGVIGRKKEQVLTKFVTQLPARFEVAEGDIRLNGVIVDVDSKTGRADSIRRVDVKL